MLQELTSKIHIFINGSNVWALVPDMNPGHWSWVFEGEPFTLENVNLLSEASLIRPNMDDLNKKYVEVRWQHPATYHDMQMKLNTHYHCSVEYAPIEHWGLTPYK